MQIFVLFIGKEPDILKNNEGSTGKPDFISVFWAENVAEAMELLKKRQFDLIVSGSYLPENEYCKLAEFSGEDGRRIPFLFFDENGGSEAAEDILDVAYGIYSLKYGENKLNSAKVAFEWIRDITGNKEAERTLSVSEKRSAGLFNIMRLMCDNVPDLIWAKDIDNRYLFANKAMCDILLNASDTSEPIGKTDLYFAERERAAHPEDPDWHTFGEICRDSDEITMQAKKACQFDEFGNVRGKFLFLDVHKAPFLNENGDMIGTVGSARDVTEQKRAEEELVVSEERLRFTLDATNDAIWDWDLQSGNAVLSPRWYTMLGYEPDEIPGSYELWKSLLHPDDVERSEKVIQDYIKDGDRFYQLEFRMRTKEGGWRWIHARGRVISRDEDGRPLRMVGVHTDINDWKLAEIALKESEHKFRTLVDGAAEMLFLHDLDGNVIDVNKKAISKTGYSRDELLSMNVTDLDPDSAGRDDFRVIWHGRDFYDDLIFETRHRRKDGFVYPAEVHAVKILISGRSFVLALATDISERKEAEDTLRKSEQKYRDIFENSVAGLFKTEPDGRIIDANDSFALMYGYDCAEELLKSRVNIYNLYFNRAEREKILQAISGEGKIQNYEVLQKKMDQTPFWMSVNGRTVYDSDGSVLYYEGSAIDITKKKQADEALSLANRKLQILSAITRHDILNHITVIRAILDLIDDTGYSPENMKYLRDIGDSAVAIEENIVFTREYEKLGIDKPSWFCISDLVKKIRCRDIPVNNECGDVRVYADPMLEKVFANLMDNTLRHGEGATWIDLTCQNESGNGELTIIWKDNGAGIPDSEKETIFNRGVGKNTGFGLFLSREILSITGIMMKETGREGEGARFMISVPAGVWKI